MDIKERAEMMANASDVQREHLTDVGNSLAGMQGASSIQPLCWQAAGLFAIASAIDRLAVAVASVDEKKKTKRS
jgi:hypothetical protein